MPEEADLHSIGEKFGYPMMLKSRLLFVLARLNPLLSSCAVLVFANSLTVRTLLAQDMVPTMARATQLCRTRNFAERVWCTITVLHDSHAALVFCWLGLTPRIS